MDNAVGYAPFEAWIVLKKCHAYLKVREERIIQLRRLLLEKEFRRTNWWGGLKYPSREDAEDAVKLTEDWQSINRTGEYWGDKVESLMTLSKVVCRDISRNANVWVSAELMEVLEQTPEMPVLVDFRHGTDRQAPSASPA